MCFTDNGGFPLNPYGRTGLTGRGVLGRWGPNHALDAVVSRWKRYPDGDFELKNNKKILEFIGVKREDNDEWSLPGVSHSIFTIPTFPLSRICNIISELSDQHSIRNLL